MTGTGSVTENELNAKLLKCFWEHSPPVEYYFV